jgi:Cof subfamily protein (haloacid dehalogenase superfamily)
MNLNEVKLVVTDMDGTLLNSKGVVSEKFMKLYHALSDYGVYFVAASGRQYFSIVHKLNSIKDNITVIAENGGLVIKKEQQLLIKDIPVGIAHSFVKDLRKIKGAYIILCGKKCAYVENREADFIDMFNEYYHKYQIVEDLTKVKDDIFLKIASYHFENSEKYIYPQVKIYEKDFQVKVSGKNWLDISHPNANKGIALKYIQEQMGISKNETMVFGDYNNDLEMLKLANFSYAMENSHPNVKSIANFQTSSNDDFGVEIVLEKLLAAKKQ